MNSPTPPSLFSTARFAGLLAVFVLVLTSAMSTLKAQQQGVESVLRPGDSIIIMLSGIPVEFAQGISKPYEISERGTINLTYLGEFQAAGLRPSELQKRIENAYINAEIFTKPTIEVTHNRESGAGTQVIFVSGEVKQPMPVPMRPGMSVHDAITSAHGPTDFAKMKEVKLTRNGVTRVLDLRRADNPDALLPVQAGDRIHVP